jgi:hypothetical protein
VIPAYGSEKGIFGAPSAPEKQMVLLICFGSPKNPYRHIRVPPRHAKARWLQM